MSRRRLGRMLAALALATTAVAMANDAAVRTPDSEVARLELERLRRAGDTQGQRDHAWTLFRALASPVDARGSTAFESWYGEDRVFAAADSDAEPVGILGFTRADAGPGGTSPAHGAESADTSPLVYTLYNEAAHAHIRRHRLYEGRVLERLRRTTAPAGESQGRPAVPAFPRGAVVAKSAWWPAARDRSTPLPVWDPRLNPARREGNALVGWARVVAVEPRAEVAAHGPKTIAFAGQARAVAARVPLTDFHYVTVDAALAARLQRDPALRKLAVLVLGRPLAAGDHLLLVGVHLATREIDDWIWGTVWWHDAADVGSYAAGRPDALAEPWRNYLLDVAFDASLPAAADGGPHVSFNPWFEARFPDGGHGGGTVSNCMACHRRAGFPAVPFLPVTRGEPDLRNDPAFARDRLATNSLWSLAMHARD